MQIFAIDAQIRLPWWLARSAAATTTGAATPATRSRCCCWHSCSASADIKLGFQTEGRLRDHEFFAGQYHDVVLMGQTVDEFAERFPFPDVTVR
jgi:hypothetical protein